MSNIGIFGTLQIAKEGLFVQQSSVSVTSHNLANVNTEGYSRQQPVISTIDPQLIGGIYFGRGARLTAITKSYDKFLNNSIMLEKNILGQWKAKETHMSRLETVVNESGENGLNARFTEFWNAWHDVADNPTGIAERAVLQRAGQSLANAFQNMYRNLEQVQTDANNSVVNTIASINRLAQEIAGLNAQILGTETQGGNANDLTDARALKLEELSELIDIRMLESSNGQITVLTSFGKPLVADNVSWELAAKVDENRNNNYAVYFVDKSSTLDITDKITGGKLKGILEIRDTLVPSYLERLNTLAATLIAEVNKRHYQGYGLDGSTGNYFFNPVPITIQELTSTTGMRLYNAQVTDPTQLSARSVVLRFSSAPPQEPRYELYDETNDQYIFRIDAENSTLVFDDGGGDTIVALAHGDYTGKELAAELERQLDAHASVGQDYAVSYNSATRKFTIMNKGAAAVDFKWGAADSTAATVLGFADTFTITTGVNDTISFDDGTGAAAETAVLKAGTYTGQELALEVKRSLEAAGTAQFAVAYDAANRAFTITVTAAAAPQNNVDFFWSSSSAAATLGFGADTLNISVDSSDASSAVPVLQTVAGGSITGRFDAGTYTYAAQHIQIISNLNDEIVFRDDGTLTYRSAKLNPGIYSPDELADEIMRQLEASSGAGQTYTVTFDKASQTFTIRNNAGNANSLDLLWARSNAATTLGFDAVNTLGIATGAADASDTGRYCERLFTVVSGFDSIVFDDGGTGGSVTALLTAGTYTGEELAAEIERQLESTSGASGQDYIVTFDSRSGAFTIVNAAGNLHAIDFDWTTSTAAATLGFTAAATPPVAVGGLMRSDNTPVGSAAAYDTIAFNGISVRMSDDSALPVVGTEFSISTITDAAKIIATDTVTASDPSKIAAALDAFDIDGSNNTIVFDDDGTLGSTTYRVVIPNGRYTPQELAREIERQLEQNGSGQSYAVTYDTATRKFSIASNPSNTHPLFLLWDNPVTNAAFTLGFHSSIFEISAGMNDDIDFNENGSPFTATLTPGRYTGEELAVEIQKQLMAQGDGEYTVTYDTTTRKFTITNSSNNTNNLTLAWSTSGAAATLGFDSVDTSGIPPGSSDTSDFSFGSLAVGTATASDFATGGPQIGDNRNALDLAALTDLPVLEQGTMTIGQYYSVMTGRVGNDAQDVNNGVKQEEFIIHQYEQRRKSIAGVSVDEEMINLIKYQQAFAASAKLIAALDEMLDKLLSIRS